MPNDTLAEDFVARLYERLHKTDDEKRTKSARRLRDDAVALAKPHVINPASAAAVDEPGEYPSAWFWMAGDEGVFVVFGSDGTVMAVRAKGRNRQHVGPVRHLRLRYDRLRDEISCDDQNPEVVPTPGELLPRYTALHATWKHILDTWNAGEKKDE